MLVPFMSVNFFEYIQWETVVMAALGVVALIPQSSLAIGLTAPHKHQSHMDWGHTAWWTNKRTHKRCIWSELLLLLYASLLDLF